MKPDWLKQMDLKIYAKLLDRRERQDAWIKLNYPDYQSVDRSRQIETLDQAKRLICR